MGEIKINPLLNVHDKYNKMNIINPYRFEEVDNSGEVGNYNFNETEGTTLFDNSGLGNNGSNSGALINQTGKLDKCYSFDGLNDKVDIADNLSLQFGTGNFTVAFWANMADLKTVDLASQNTLISKNYRGFELTLYLGKLSSYIGGIEEGDIVNGTTLWSANQWYFVLFERNDTELRYELNNVLEASKARNNKDVSKIGVNLNLGFRAGYGSTTKQYLKGKLDAMRIYNRALTRAEKDNLFNAGIGIE